MTLSLELSHEQETRLRREAERHGLEAEAYLLRLIEQHLGPASATSLSLWRSLPVEEWVRLTRVWSEDHRSWPVLPPGADDRASLYEERE